MLPSHARIATGVRKTHVLTVRETVSRSAIYPKIARYRILLPAT